MNALEQCRVAEELGFDHVWAVEHHFLEEYSHCSAPELFLTAVAARTQRIRVGHGAVVCVPEMNHPVRVAERAAALDIISGGRLEVGTARSSPWTELGAADRGIGCLGVAAVTFAEQERRTAEYRRRIQLCDPVGGINDAVTTQNFLYCHEDIDVAAEIGGSMAMTFGLSNSHLLWTREAYPTSAYQSLGNLQAPAAKRETGAPGERRPLPE